MAKKQRRCGGRTTQKGTRPQHLHAVKGDRPTRPPVDVLIDEGARAVLGEGTALGAEVWASQVLSLFDANRTVAALTGKEVPPFERALLDRAAARRDRSARVVATALAAVVPPPLDDLARHVVGQLGSVPGPAWLAEIGTAQPTEAWVASDVFGDQDAVILRFEERGGGSHAVVTLVDHNLDGQAKDVWLSDDPVGVVELWTGSDDAHMHTVHLPTGDAMARVATAMAASELWNGDAALRTEDFAHNRALVLARLRRAGHGLPDGDLRQPTRPSAQERRAIVRDFLASPAGRAVAASIGKQDVRLLAEHLVDVRSDYEGRPLRWSPIVVEMVLGELARPKVPLAADQAAALPDVVRAFVRFAATQTGLDDRFVDEILEAVAAHEVHGVASRAAPSDAVESAARAEVLARFDALAAFYGDGRKVTANGNPTLADARQLVELLGTSDRLDRTYGGKVVRTRSASELQELDFTLRWAMAAGALRKQGAKLRATDMWASLADKPLERWQRAAEALPVLGPMQGWFPRAMPGFKRILAFLDDLAPALLTELLPQPLAFDALLDALGAHMDDAFEWSDYWDDPEFRRRAFRRDLDALIEILGWAGVVTRTGAELVPDDLLRDHLVPRGGLVGLTPVGRWWLVQPGM